MSGSDLLATGELMTSRQDDPCGRDKEDSEDFYDCQETLESVDQQQDEGEKTPTSAERLCSEQQEEESQTAAAGQEESDGSGDDRRQENGLHDTDPAHGDAGPDYAEVQGPEDDSDSELKEEKSQVLEFDDEYLREAEKELTEEEKESRRQQSLSLKERGNSQFKSGDWAEAEGSYTEALVSCPVCFSRERAVLFSNRAAARLHMDKKELAIGDCSRAIELNPDYLRALLRRAELYEQTEKLDEALEDYKTVLERDPSQNAARQACMRLPQQINERNEKLKEEMMSKLKDLGNMFLRPFGLSTSNFEVNQDTGTGSYSLKFVQNPNNNNR
ncbi:tetratricopeptide repeat protein 1 [Synchiropus picturatus]